MTTDVDSMDAVPERDRDAIESWLVNKMASIADMSRDEVDVDRAFVDFHLDSSVAVSVTNQLSEWLERELPITLFWEYPTISALASALPVLSLPRLHSLAEASNTRLAQ